MGGRARMRGEASAAGGRGGRCLHGDYEEWSDCEEWTVVGGGVV
jgi:hypothetical protein